MDGNWILELGSEYCIGVLMRGRTRFKADTGVGHWDLSRGSQGRTCSTGGSE